MQRSPWRYLVAIMASLTTVLGVSSTPAAERLVFISAFAPGDKGAIHAYQLDLDSGTMKLAQRTTGAENPFFLAVSDTGVGIAPEDFERVFDRFYRTDESRTRDSGGFGLGLSIARDLVQAMGGGISVSSQVGLGSSFRVRLPRAAGAPE